MPRGNRDFDAKIDKLSARETGLDWWVRLRDEKDDAKQDSDVVRSCSRKDRYESESAARAVSAMNNMSSALARI